MKNITVSVDEDLYKQVRIVAAHLDISVSELVRRKLGEAIKENNQKNSYEIGKDLFGNGSIGSINLSRDCKKYLKGIIQKKHAKRNSL
jgi:metal-responsive CopG/Arc/MetJ family transcriptional regulator